MQSPDAKSTLQAAQDLVALVVGGYAGVSFQITGTWVGTISFEGTVDGATWVAIQVTNVATGVQVSSATANAALTGGCPGLRQVRARMSAYTSGIAVVTVKAAGDAAGGGSSGGGGGGAVTIADGADVAEGATTDAAVTTDTTGTVSGKLRGLIKWAFERMPAALGQGVMAASLPVVVASDQSAIPVTISGGGGGGTASAFGDPIPADGTAAGFEDPDGNMAPAHVTAAGEMETAVANGANVALGATTDATVQGNNTGSVNARLRGISVVLNSVWDAVNNWLKVSIQNATLAVTQSGSWVLSAGSAIIGKVEIDQTTPGTTNGVVVNSSALPTGAATAANQQTDALTDAELRATPVDVALASVPLPTGAATLAEQQAQTALLTTIDADTGLVAGSVASSRMQVNPIVGQAGVAAGAGAVGATVQRTTLASDDPAVAVLGATTGAAVITDANGTIQQYLRGLVKLAITAGSWLVSVTGTVADDATTPGNPVMTGGQAKSPDGTDPGNVSAEDDVARFISDLNRRQYVNTVHPRFGHKHLNGSSAYTDETIVADPGDGFQVVITNIIASTGAATALNFFLEEGSTTIFGPIYLEAVAGRGFASGPIHLPITPSTAVTLTSSAAIAQSFDFDYFIQKV